MKCTKMLAGVTVIGAGFYYYYRNARTPGAIINEAAKDVKGAINTVASGANKVVDTGAGGAAKVADKATLAVNKAVK